jgi:hypothetical protein
VLFDRFKSPRASSVAQDVVKSEEREMLLRLELPVYQRRAIASSIEGNPENDPLEIELKFLTSMYRHLLHLNLLRRRCRFEVLAF